MIYKGTQGADVYLGTAEADVIEGFGGSDRLGGAGGDDQIAGGAGADTLDGGDGNDVLFSESLGAVPFPYDWFDAPLDTLAYRDVLTGGDGDDTVVAGTGDSIDGGAGTDRLALSLILEAAGLSIDLDLVTAGGVVALGSTSVSGIERVVALQATAFGDDIRYLVVPDGAYLAIDGAGGDDHIVVGAGKGGNASGTVDGGDGDDLLEGRTGYTGELLGGAGDDHVDGGFIADGGAGNDVLVDVTYGHGGDGDDHLSTTLGTVTNLWGDAGDDTISGAARADYLYGGDGADVVSGGAGNDQIWAGAGGIDNEADVDQVDGGDGDDRVSIGYGDSADGGAGRDTLGLSLAGAAAGVVLDTTAFTNGGTVRLGGRTITGFEVFGPLAGSAWGDRITAYSAVVYAGDGNDRLIAAGRAASLHGEAGDDVILANGAGSTYNGNEGRDTIDFSLLTRAITLKFEAGTAGLASTRERVSGFEVAIGTAFGDTLDTGDNDLTLLGGDGDDKITLGIGVDRISGGTGDDTIVLRELASAGAGDLLSGGAGFDRLIASGPIDLSSATLDGTIEWIDLGDAPGHTLTLAAAQSRGVTRIDASAIRLASAGTADFRAATLDTKSIILADAGSRLLIGKGSVDHVYGSARADSISSASTIALTIDGGAGNDVVSLASATGAGTLNGNEGNDRLIGGAGADVIDGGVGRDLLQGGQGDDRYLAVEIGDVVREEENGGIDTVETSINLVLAPNVENLVMLGYAQRGTGNALDNAIVGNGSANILDGKAGADVMTGGAGNDLYYVDNAGDRVVEIDSTFSTDTVYASTSYTLPDHVEKLVITAGGQIGTGGAGADTLVANAGGVTLYGFDGNDVLSSPGGAGRLIGGAGDDVYLVDGAGDVIVEAVDGGVDRVIASANYTLSANVESLELTGQARIGQGNAGTNTITGSAGADTLKGMAGIDVLTGGYGDDTLWGGTGQDALFGNAGADIFAFARGDSSADWTQADGIADFHQFERDRIDLTALGDLSFIGTAGFNGGAQVRFEEFDGDTLISIDTNGDRTADMVIGVLGSVSFTAADFILA